MSITTSGGAIKLVKPALQTRFKKVAFKNCLSTSFGGAIYYQGSIIALENTCFDTCTSIEGGQAIFSYLDKSNSFFLLENSNVIKSSDRSFIGLCQSIFIDNGIQNFSFINSSFNVVESEAAAIHSTRNSGFVTKQSVFVNNTGSTIFWLHKLSKLSILQYLNIIDNHVNQKGAVFYFEESVAMIQNVVLINNQGYLFDGGISLQLKEVYSDNMNILSNNNNSLQILSNYIITNSETYHINLYSNCNDQSHSQSPSIILIPIIQDILEKQIESKTYRFSEEELVNENQIHAQSLSAILLFSILILCILAFLLRTRLYIRKPAAFRI